ncbi:chorismate lyase [Niveibacterium sp. SC-1]|uniref:chorismate--pyruvate lyase family protein n=1 Tax=Niveibacterium sp. SC-1 TaxID=3135646 RepID=UPI00311E2309
MSLRNLYRPSAESWLARPACNEQAEPARLRRWLTDRGSLTARIRARCQRFEVRVLRQHLARPAHDEQRLLGLRAHESALVREVLLVADGIPVIFAHSVVAPRHVRGAWHLVAGLGTRPLAAVIFADPRVRRGQLRYKRLDCRDARYANALRASDETADALWARRSVFRRGSSPLLVTELFLSPILALPDAPLPRTRDTSAGMRASDLGATKP